MERVHIFLDGVVNCEGKCPDVPANYSVLPPIEKGTGPIFITTFAITNEQDIDVLEYYMERVLVELRKRFKGKVR